MKDVVIRFTGQSTKFLHAFSSNLKRLQPQSLKNLLWLFTDPGRRRQSDSNGSILVNSIFQFVVSESRAKNQLVADPSRAACLRALKDQSNGHKA